MDLGIDLLKLFIEAVRASGTRTVIRRLRRTLIDLRKTFGCEECGARWPEMFVFMLKDEVWDEVTDGDVEAHLCLRCSQKKLGRLLAPDDFTAVPMNDAILCGIAIAFGRPLPTEGFSGTDA